MLKRRLREARRADEVFIGVGPRTMLRTFSIVTTDACGMHVKTENIKLTNALYFAL